MITVNLKNYDEFVNAIGKLVVDKAINDGIKKTIIKLDGKAKLEQRNQGVFDTGLLASESSYKKKFNESKMTGELYNIRKYGLFQHEGYEQWVWGRNTGVKKKGRPWFTDTLNDNKYLPEKTINKELTNTLKKLGVKL